MREGSSGHQAGWEHDPEAEPSPYAPTEFTPPHARTEYPPTYSPTEVAPPHPPTRPASPHRPAHAASPHGPTRASSPYGPTQGSGSGRPQELVRYGPGVPAASEGQAELTAERAWRTGRPDKPYRRPARWRRLAGSALTVILLAASGVLLYLKFHHAPFHVTGAAITQRTQNGCGVNVTGRIDTNGAAGTVSYQWVFQPDPHAPAPLSHSVVSGQHSVYVTVAVEGSGKGTASQKVTLQVLGPDKAADSADVVIICG